jgi:DNA-binding transcriptional ArsR family regulator
LVTDHAITLRGVRSLRELRGETLRLALELQGSSARGTLVVRDPKLSRETIEEAWHQAMAVIPSSITDRMEIQLETAQEKSSARSTFPHWAALWPKRILANFRYEIIRQLLAAHMKSVDGVSYAELAERIGASYSPIIRALKVLTDARLVRPVRRGAYALSSDWITAERLKNVGAEPPKVSLRFAQGSRLNDCDQLLDRLVALKTENPVRTGWRDVHLSGLPVAQADMPSFGLLGMGRLELLANLHGDQSPIGPKSIYDLYHGLEIEPNPFDPAPVNLVLVKGQLSPDGLPTIDGVSRAHPADVYLAIDAYGYAEQAREYFEIMKTRLA